MTSFDRHAIRAICGIEKSKALSVVFGSLAYFRELIAEACKKSGDREGASQFKLLDIPIPLKLFIDELSNGSLFSGTSASTPTSLDARDYCLLGAWYLIFHLSAKFCNFCLIFDLENVLPIPQVLILKY